MKKDITENTAQPQTTWLMCKRYFCGFAAHRHAATPKTQRRAPLKVTWVTKHIKSETSENAARKLKKEKKRKHKGSKMIFHFTLPE